MNKPIVLRIYSHEGRQRITVNAADTFGELLLNLSKQLKYLIKDLIVMTEDSKLMNIPNDRRLRDIPYFQDGAVLRVESKTPRKDPHTGVSVADLKSSNNTNSKCTHGPQGKCLNCIGDTPANTTADPALAGKQKCSHGPNAKCLNCMKIDPKEIKSTTQNCQHGPNAKCVHCLDAQYISNTAHMSFDQFLQDKKLKCKGVHPSDVKCNNCLPPSKIKYEVDRNCKYHEPYPKAMCSKCAPSNVIIKRQEYRHVDYVQFMNIAQIQDFIRYWVKEKKMAEKRVGYLYGYYAEDPNYKGGIRIIVEALYEPAQKGSFNDFQMMETEQETNCVEMLANGLTLERVGWIYTETNHDTVMDAQHVRQAARFQQQFRVQHESGYDISNFVTVILRTDEKDPNNVSPEVFMISDQGQAIERSNLFVQPESRKMMKVKEKEHNNDSIPGFICNGKNTTQFEPEFLLVKIAQGTPKTNKFAILKKAQFPAFTRCRPTKKDLKKYLQDNKHHKQASIKYGDFNFLLYLAHQIDLHTVLAIAEAVAHETPISDIIDQMVEQKADL